MRFHLGVIAALAGLTVLVVASGMLTDRPAQADGPQVAASERDSSFSGSASDDDGQEPHGVTPWNGYDAVETRKRVLLRAVYQHGSTGRVISYPVMIDGRVPQTGPEVSAAVEFLSAYLDRSVPDRLRFARILPVLAPQAVPHLQGDPLFAHPPARGLTGVATSDAAHMAPNPPNKFAERVVFVGTDIGDYRVTLVSSGSGTGGWRVLFARPPQSWLHASG